jgi:hypothetical protein
MSISVFLLHMNKYTVDKLRSRFEALSRGGDEDKPQSYHMIKAAQKREELQVCFHV